MFKFYMLPIAVALTVAPTYFERANANPLAPVPLAAAAPVSDVQPVYYRGRVAGRRLGGGARRLPWRRGGTRRLYRGGVVVRGGYRVGRRYYGGVWYGTGRRWYGGRWWPYGVGTCWRPSPIGYVWVCG